MKKDLMSMSDDFLNTRPERVLMKTRPKIALCLNYPHCKHHPLKFPLETHWGNIRVLLGLYWDSKTETIWGLLMVFDVLGLV